MNDALYCNPGVRLSPMQFCLPTGRFLTFWSNCH